MGEEPTGEKKRKISGSQKRQRMKGVRAAVTDTEYTALVERARASGLSTGAYLRACALGDKGPRALHRPPVERELLARSIAELNKIGSNVNQIARALNSGNCVVPDEIEAAMLTLRRALEALLEIAGKR
jgi:hypothetical protein